MKKTPLTAEELRELEFLYTLSYDELLDYSKKTISIGIKRDCNKGD